MILPIIEFELQFLNVDILKHPGLSIRMRTSPDIDAKEDRSLRLYQGYRLRREDQ